MQAIVKEGAKFDAGAQVEWMRAPKFDLAEVACFFEVLEGYGPVVCCRDEKIRSEFDWRWRGSSSNAANRSTFERVGGLDGAGSEGIAWRATVNSFAFVELDGTFAR